MAANNPKGFNQYQKGPQSGKRKSWYEIALSEASNVKKKIVETTQPWRSQDNLRRGMKNSLANLKIEGNNANIAANRSKIRSLMSYNDAAARAGDAAYRELRSISTVERFTQDASSLVTGRMAKHRVLRAQMERSAGFTQGVSKSVKALNEANKRLEEANKTYRKANIIRARTIDQDTMMSRLFGR